MLLSVLAVAAGLASQPRIDVSEPTAAAVRQAEARVIYLGCQIAQTNLTGCQVVNEGPVDPAAAATAVKLANQMTIPQDLADRARGHIVIKLNVTP
jgi:hypothetical protein